MSNSLWPHGLQHTRLLCPSPSSRVCSDSCPLSQWCLSNSLILGHPLLLLPSIFPSIGDFSNELALCIRWPKCWSFSFSVSPSNEYSGLISFRLTSLISLLSKGLLRVFFSTAFQKHRFFGGNRVGPWEKKARNSVSESMVWDTCIGGTIAFYTPNSLKYSYMAPHSSTLAWKILWMEKPGRLQSMGSLRVGHDWVISLWLFTFMHWRRKWQPTPVFLPAESQGRGSLVGCRLWGRTESDTTEAT